MDNKQARYLHRMLDRLAEGKTLNPQDIEALRKNLPELPKQKTLEGLRKEVYAAWLGAGGNTWDYDGHELETWLDELYTQLKGLSDAAPDKPAHPEFLESEADYRKAPEGTIVACDDSSPWHKFESVWLSTVVYEGNSAEAMAGVIRCVLRWGWGE